jgi:regulator of sirC expression with transglutaminase-like and TPR domain
VRAGDEIVGGIRLRIVRWGLPVLLGFLFCIASADEKDVDARVRQWIADLGHRRFVIRQTAYEQLVELGEPAFPQLERIAKTGSPEQRYRAREIIRFVHWRTLHSGLVALSKQKDDQLDLEEGMWLISLIVDPQVKREPLQRQLDEMARDLRARLGEEVDPARAEPQVVVDALVAVLKDKYQLAGAHSNYDHPDNSSLDRVLSKKKGLPILLSHIAVSVAERLKVPIVGIPLPGRYMIKYDGARAPAGSPKDDIIIDPFGDWQILTQEGILEVIPRFDPESDLVPSSRHEVIIRMLRNLASDFDAVQLPGKAAETIKLLQLF